MHFEGGCEGKTVKSLISLDVLQFLFYFIIGWRRIAVNAALPVRFLDVASGYGFCGHSAS